MRYLTEAEETWLRCARRYAFLWMLCDGIAWIALASTVAAVVVIVWRHPYAGPVNVIGPASSASYFFASVAERYVHRRILALGPPPTERS